MPAQPPGGASRGGTAPSCADAITGPGDNGMFKLNMVQLCDYTAKKGLGTGAANAGAASVCQLAPGLFFHEEDDGWGKGR